ncbi:hypothetical protein AN1V17_29590 [Vallitalea sediminicola]
MKKKLCILFSMIFLFSSITLVSSAEISDCPIHGNHEMKFQGGTYVYDEDGNVVGSRYALYKCDCGEIFVCERHPHLGEKIGYYWTGSQLKFIGSIMGYSAYETDEINPPDCNRNHLDGFRFSY